MRFVGFFIPFFYYHNKIENYRCKRQVKSTLFLSGVIAFEIAFVGLISVDVPHFDDTDISFDVER